MAVIKTSNLSKTFRVSKKNPGVRGALKALVKPNFESVLAVKQVSFEIKPGEMVGYIGVNGAGKSTTIKMLTGILEPTSGSVEVLGRDPHKDRVNNARDIGVVFGQRTQLWWDLALIESLNLIGKIYEIPRKQFSDQLEQFGEILDIKRLFSVPIRQMSLGQKMRAELAATLIHNPKVVYLDEPTIGLDLLVKEKIRDFIRQQNREKNITVMLTTHDLGDIEELCQRVIIIDNGILIYDGPLNVIRDRFGKYSEISFEIQSITNDIDLPAGADIINREDRNVTVRFNRTQTSASKVATAVMNQAEVLDFSLTEPDLTMIVKQIYRGALNNGDGA
jgi:ABC-2 type transport system ATP-binding protein